jgi:hypothetical protein
MISRERYKEVCIHGLSRFFSRRTTDSIMIDLETRASFFARALCVADFQFVSTGIEIYSQSDSKFD